MRPTRAGVLVGIGAVAVILVGRFLGLTELYAIGASAGLLLVACGLWVRFRSIDLVVARAIRPSRVHAGNPCTVEVQIRNRARHRSPVLRLLDPVTGTKGADLLLPPIALRKSSTVAYRIPTTRRGIVTVGPMELEVVDPFGLVTSRTRAAPAAEITVLPRVIDIPPLPRSVGPDPDGSTETGSLGRNGEDFAALRPYVVGDDLRRVHWPSSARTGDLLVRQHDVPWQGRVVVVLDLRRDANDPDQVEQGISAAASVLRAHLRRGDHVRLVATDGADSGYGMGGSHLDGMLEYLAIAERHTVGGLDVALDVAARTGSGALVLISGRPAGVDIDAVDRIGHDLPVRRVVRFDRGGTTTTSRGTDVIGVPPGSSFRDPWTTATISARPTRRRRRSLA